MILKSKNLICVILCFILTVSHFACTSKASKNEEDRESRSRSPACAWDSGQDLSTRTKAQLLEKFMSPVEFKKEFGEDSLENVRTAEEDSEDGQVNQAPPACQKECKPSLRQAWKQVCSWVCRKKPPVAPALSGRDLRFSLYTSDRPGVSQNIISYSGPWTGVELMKGANTYIICHGFMSDPKSGPGEKLRDEYLKLYGSKNRPVNIILVDWSRAARAWQKHSYGVGSPRAYFPPAMYVSAVGYQIMVLVRKLSARGGISTSKMHLIGHSLGAHVVGYAGKKLAEDPSYKIDRKVGRITALDPAAPCFEKDAWNTLFCIKREDGYRPISRNDAEFVDVIHSNAALLGMTQPVGHVDFYPNGGRSQPGCCSPVCSHSRSIELMAASINGDRNNYLAVRCPNVKAALSGKCPFTSGAKLNSLGQEVDQAVRSRGIYYLQTRTSPPYYSYLQKLS